MINVTRVFIVFGVFSFISIVIALHLIQVDYDLANQFMSELVLGEKGELMLLAFLSLSFSILSCQFLLSPYPNSYIIRVLLSASSICLVGAGVFKLGNHNKLHISLVAIGFCLIILSMYLIPRLIQRFNTPLSMTMHWGLGITAVLATGLGQNIVPIGVAQRLSASAIFIWLVWFAMVSHKNKEQL